MPDSTPAKPGPPASGHRLGWAIAASTSLHVLLVVYLYLLTDGSPTQKSTVLQVKIVNLPTPAPALQTPVTAPSEDPLRQYALLTEKYESNWHQATDSKPPSDTPQPSEQTPERTEPSKTSGDWTLPRNIAIQYAIFDPENSEKLGTYLQTFDAEVSGAYRIRLEPLSSAEGVKHWQISILGNIGTDGLAPENYEYQGGFTQRLMPNTQLDTGTLNASGEHVGQISAGQLDDTSLIYQLMRIARDAGSAQHTSLKGTLPGGYAYLSVGQETLSPPSQEPQNTLRLIVTKSGSAAKTEVWLAIDLQFIPLQVLSTDSNGQSTLRVAQTYSLK